MINRVIWLVVMSNFLQAGIDFSKHIVKDNTILEVTNVKANDFLNLREDPTVKGKKLYKIPYDAKNLMSFDKEIVEKLGRNIWIPIRLGFSEGFVNGWVKAKYVKLYQKFEALVQGDLLVIFPHFIEGKTKGGWIFLNDSIEMEHYSGCDERDNPKLLIDWSRFDIRLKVHYTLQDVFDAEEIFETVEYDDVTTFGWFNEDTKTFNIKKVNRYGLDGYRYSVGVEGCGINYYFFKINGKVLTIREPFNHQLPRLKENQKLPKDWKYDDKDEIMQYIIKHLRVF